MRRTAGIALCIALCFAALFASSALAADQFVLRIGMVVSDKDPMFEGSMALKKAVEEKSGGRLKIEVYPSSQLGGTDDLQEQAKMGANVAVITDAGRMASLVKEVGILGAPYIADNYEQARKIATSDLAKDWSTKLEAFGYKILAFNWFQGTRHFLTNKPIKTPADLKGLRIRTPGSPVWRETVAAMGGTPTDLPWSEVYPGLQQKVIDGCEAQYPAVVGAHLEEVVKYVTKTGHFQLLTCMVVGKKFFDSLPADLQKMLEEESVKAGDFASKLTLDGIPKYEEAMKKAGVNVVEIDTTPFKQATEAVYEKLGYKDLREQVRKILAK